jgi:hypothetical protein
MDNFKAERPKRGRPPKVTAEVWAKIKAAAISGCTNQEICTEFGIGIATLMRLLNQNSNRCEVEVGKAKTAADILAALGKEAMKGRADSARLILRRLNRM